MFFDEVNKIRGSISRQRRFTKMRVLRDKIFGPCVDICKITPSAAGDDYLAANLGVMLNDEHPFPMPPGGNSAKQPGRTTADDDRINNQRVLRDFRLLVES